MRKILLRYGFVFANSDTYSLVRDDIKLMSFKRISVGQYSTPAHRTPETIKLLLDFCWKLSNLICWIFDLHTAHTSTL